MNFLIQKVNNKIVHDFAFELTQAKDYLEWRRVDKMSLRFLNYVNLLGTTVKNPDRYIPVGEVDFVAAYIRQFYPKCARALRPLNVPEELFPYAGRTIVNVTRVDDLGVFEASKLYIKSNRRIKWPGNGLLMPDTDMAMLLDCQVSEVVEVGSEWRVFVFHNEIQHIANYSGDCTLFPNVSTIKAMVGTYAGAAPVAYTLDVGVKPGGETFVMECHRFFSCGLYGFSDHSVIPYMLSQAWFEIKQIKEG